MKSLLIFASIIALISFLPSSFAENEDKIAVLHTNSGKLAIEFFPDDAPNHVSNFIELAESGFYDRTVFHRVIEDFMIQGGDPKTKPGEFQSFTEWGTGDPGYSVDAEFNDIKHNRGIVSMARSSNPNSAGSQFFIVHQDSNFLDGQYTVFGRLVTQESFETLDKIATIDTPHSLGDAAQGQVGATIPTNWGDAEIQKIEIVERSNIPNILELDEPERTSNPIQTPEMSDAEYTNDKLGISFTAPEGWSIQEPQKTHSGVPDIVLIGPPVGSINPTISISAVFANGRSLDEYVKEIDQTLRSSIDSGNLEILSLEKIKIDGKNAHIRNAIGKFERDNSTINVQFRELNMISNDKIYTLTYSNDKDNFENSLQRFETIINTFSITNGESPTNSQNEEGGGCLIATATFGSELSPQVQNLREIRDNVVMQTQSGAAFMSGFNQMYYSFSPIIADLERENPLFKEAVKITITPLLASLSLLNYIEINSDVEMLGYGLSIISLNVGLYFGLPAIIIYRLRK